MPASRGRGSLVTYLYFIVILRNREPLQSVRDKLIQNSRAIHSKMLLYVGRWSLWRHGRASDLPGEFVSRSEE